MIDDEFARHLMATVNDPSEHPVHVLFNRWWSYASDDVKQAYVDGIAADPSTAPLLDGGTYAAPLDLDELAALPDGTLGRRYHDWIIDNGLTAQIALDYRSFHDALADAGHLDGMPQAIRYAVLRGFQTHDFQHVLTGYDASGRGEIALQAFGLAQLRFPYFGMWLAVVTTRMTFIEPSSITPMMDAITDGWQRGRRAQSIQAVAWEELLAEPVTALRDRFDLDGATLLDRLAGVGR